MGLIQKIALQTGSDTVQEETKKKKGLLERIRSSSEYDLVLNCFLDFLAATGAERGGILYPVSDIGSVLLFSSGFDLTTSRRFSPDTETFSKLVPVTNGWNVLSGSVLEPVYPLFSSREKNSLVSLHVLPTVIRNTKAYIVLARSNLDISRRDLDIASAQVQLDELRAILDEKAFVIDALVTVHSVTQSIDSMKERARSAIEAGKKASLISVCMSALFPDIEELMTDMRLLAMYEAIVHSIARKAGSANIVYNGNKPDLKVVLFTAQNIDSTLYFNQLLLPLNQVFGSFRISRIQIQYEGVTDSVQEILHFLNGAE